MAHKNHDPAILKYASGTGTWGAMGSRERTALNGRPVRPPD
jgi:hypothetical protein